MNHGRYAFDEMDRRENERQDRLAEVRAQAARPAPPDAELDAACGGNATRNLLRAGAGAVGALVAASARFRRDGFEETARELDDAAEVLSKAIEARVAEIRP